MGGGERVRIGWTRIEKYREVSRMRAPNLTTVYVNVDLCGKIFFEYEVKGVEKWNRLRVARGRGKWLGWGEAR